MLAPKVHPRTVFLCAGHGVNEKWPLHGLESAIGIIYVTFRKKVRKEYNGVVLTHAHTAICFLTSNYTV